MPTTISGTNGVSQCDTDSVSTNDIQNGAVTPAKTQMGALPSMVRVSGYTGYPAAPNNYIPRFTTTETSQGSDVTYVGDGTVGNTFTVNTNGVYAITFSGGSNMNIGISLNANSTDTATTVNSLAVAKRLSSSGGGVSMACNASWVGYLASGSVIRAHTDGAAGFGGISPTFTIQRVA